MLVKDFYNLVRKGYKPVVKINEKFEYLVEESADAEMICQVINASPDDICGRGNSVRFELDFSKFEEHNKLVAQPNWRDSSGNLTLKWMDSSFYPENGIEAIYLPTNEEIPFEIMDENSLFHEYIEEKSEMSYVNWLEKELVEMRKLNNNIKNIE